MERETMPGAGRQRGGQGRLPLFPALLLLAAGAALLWVIVPFARSLLRGGQPADARPLAWEYRAATLPVWSKDGYYDSGPALDAIAAAGANSVTFVATWYVADEQASEIRRTSRTASDTSLTWAIKQAKARGLRVFLKPHVDLESGAWRAYIDPRDPDRWFQQYTEMMTHYADLAAMHEVDLLSVGAELISLSTNPAHEGRWRDLIAGLRRRFSGRLTYSANWGGGYFAEPGFADEMSRLPFWDALDYLGVSAYFELAETDSPSVEDLRRSWGRWQEERLAPFQRRWRRPVLFTEIGYRSADGAARMPWEHQQARSLDTREQADCWEAFFASWQRVTWFAGAALWAWSLEVPGNPEDTGYLIQNKPAEETVRRWFGGDARPAAHRP